MDIVVQEPHSGFPGVVHGGYLGGLVARELGGAVEVSFHRAPRIGETLHVERADADRLVVRGRGDVVAEAVRARVDVVVPAAPTLAAAREAGERYPGRTEHPFPQCFCCGPERVDEGLGISVGPLEGEASMAGTWTPSTGLALPDGTVRPEIVWAALDCPAIWALALQTPRGAPERLVTGRLAVDLRARITADHPYVIVAWPLGAEGRRRFSAAAVLSSDGEPFAVAKETCVVSDRGVPIGRWGAAGGATVMA